MPDCFLLTSFSSVGKALSFRSVRARKAHVLWGRGTIHVPRQKTLCPLVLCDSREVTHLHASVSSCEKLWVMTNAPLSHNLSIFILILTKIYSKKKHRYGQICNGRLFFPSDKGAWLKARTVTQDSSCTKTMLWDSPWMPSCSREWRTRWAKCFKSLHEKIIYFLEIIWLTFKPREKTFAVR